MYQYNAIVLSIELILLSIMPLHATTHAEAFELREDIEFSKPEGVSLKLDAFLASDKRAVPAVVYVHGGGFVAGDKRSIRESTSELGVVKNLILDAGVSLISINYRLAPQYPYPAAPNDIQDAIAYIKRHAAELRIDPNRLALMGESAGGMLVSHAGAKYRPGNQVATVISFYGEHDFLLRVSENPCAIDGYAIERPAGGCISHGMAAFLGFDRVNAENQALLRDATVVSHVHQAMPPYLLIHGTRDYGVPIEQAHSMQQAMNRVGAECRLAAIVGGGHGGWSQPDQQHYKSTLVDWIKEKLSVE